MGAKGSTSAPELRRSSCQKRPTWGLAAGPGGRTRGSRPGHRAARQPADVTDEKVVEEGEHVLHRLLAVHVLQQDDEELHVILSTLRTTSPPHG